uniref:Uncharacterized protein n=1 Tax=Manihot esculenta TaxID=3983 RepID=A0A2C9UFN7_MANES
MLNIYMLYCYVPLSLTLTERFFIIRWPQLAIYVGSTMYGCSMMFLLNYDSAGMATGRCLRN